MATLISALLLSMQLKCIHNVGLLMPGYGSDSILVPSSGLHRACILASHKFRAVVYSNGGNALSRSAENDGGRIIQIPLRLVLF